MQVVRAERTTENMPGFFHLGKETKKIDVYHYTNQKHQSIKEIEVFINSTPFGCNDFPFIILFGRLSECTHS